MRTPSRAVLSLFVLLVGPVGSHAQGLGAIAGIVRDSSGAVLPGVAVEVASPALIEQVRVTTTDGTGRYSIINLPPGTYGVTFALSGFNSIRRDGVELLANFTAPINAEMTVGALAETVTVSGGSPLVDVQSARTVRAVTPDMIRALPNGGTMYQLAQLTVGVVYTGIQDVGGASGSPVNSQVVAHGGRPGDEQQQLDGLRIGNFASQSGRSQQTLSPLLYEQVDIQLSGQGADVGTNGVITNAIPRSGGNTFSGIFLLNGSGERLQSSNLTSDLEARGLSAGDSKLGLRRLFDINGALGGPLKRDRLWFYVTGRFQTNDNYVAGTFFPVDPRAWERVEDRTRQASDPQYIRDTTSRLTWLITPNMRLAGTTAIQRKWWDYWALDATVSPEAAGRVTWPGRIFSGVWTYTASNRLLFEAGLNRQRSGGRIVPRPGEEYGRRIVEQGGVVFNGQPLAPITYGAYGGEAGFINDEGQAIYNARASTSYVTGSHNFKVGMDLMRGSGKKNGVNYIDDIRYRTRGFELNQVTLYAPLGRFKSYLDYNLGAYVQDRWTVGRLSLSGGLRFEFQKESNDAYTAGPTKYLPNRNLFFPAADVVDVWKQVNPRAGVAYDLFGDGRTALKASAVRSVVQEGLNTAFNLNPANSLSTNTSINVVDANRNRVPDCDLFDPRPNGECLGWLNANFGSPTPQTQWDPRALNGWGVRPWNWEFSGGIQHQLRSSLTVGLMYYRRIYGGFLVTESPETTAADYTEFAVAVPTDPRLPNSGGHLTVVDVNPVLTSGRPFNIVTNRTTFASDFGSQREHWNGVDVTGDWRLHAAAKVQGGVTFGKAMTDNCEIVAALPETLGSTPKEFCHRTTGWEPNYKTLASYTLPWQDVRISGFFISTPGPDTLANVIYSSASLVPALGRSLSGGGNKTVGVISPRTIYGDRRNQFDLRFSKIFRVGGGRTLDANFDLYNAFNSDAVTSESATYGATWRRPIVVLQGRIIKFGMWLNF